MKRRAALVSALAFSIGLHVFLILAGRTPRPPLSPEAARVPDRLYSVTIRFPENAAPLFEAPAEPASPLLLPRK